MYPRAAHEDGVETRAFAPRDVVRERITHGDDFSAGVDAEFAEQRVVGDGVRFSHLAHVPARVFPRMRLRERLGVPHRERAGHRDQFASRHRLDVRIRHAQWNFPRRRRARERS